ncbi:hypothetical protein [Streptomyces sp. NPDC001507]|uniref:hypothetical protein n=1 Tax=Streptomyces sp. NPDC001507 TaxID=3364579 RepID=UPI00368C0E4D
MQRRQPLEVGGVEGVTGRGELLVLVGIAVGALAGQVVQQEVAGAEAHGPVDLPYGNVAPRLPERPLPR